MTNKNNDLLVLVVEFFSSIWHSLSTGTVNFKIHSTKSNVELGSMSTGTVNFKIHSTKSNAELGSNQLIIVIDQLYSTFS